MGIEEFKKKWLEAFAKGIAEEDIPYYFPDREYIWHIFSWKVMEDSQYLEGDAASEAFEKADKTGVMYIEPFDKDASLRPLNQEMHSAALLDDRFVEVYIVSADWTWTYIKTHENDLCGPYFRKLN